MPIAYGKFIFINKSKVEWWVFFMILGTLNPLPRSCAKLKVVCQFWDSLFAIG